MEILNNGKKYKLKLIESVKETKEIKSVSYGELNAVVPDFVEKLHIVVAGGGGSNRAIEDTDDEGISHGSYTQKGGNGALVEFDLIGDETHSISGASINASVGNKGNQTTLRINAGENLLVIIAGCGGADEEHNSLGSINGGFVNNVKNMSFTSANNANAIGWISVSYTYEYTIQKIYKVVI